MYNRQTEELFTIRQDVMDPLAKHAGMETGLQGCEIEVRLDGAKIEVPVRWRDRMTVVDVYEVDDHLMIHLYCPQCTQCLRIESRKKSIRFDRGSNRLEVDKISCSYPQCDWSVTIKDNFAQDA